MRTTAQSLILLGQQLAPANPLNNMAFAFTFREALDVARMQAAFAQLVSACDAMRTVVRDGKTVVHDTIDFELRLYDNSALRDPFEAIYAGIRGEVQQAFNLSERLFAASLYKARDEHYVLYLNQHHLITDGWGYAVQLDYLLSTYAGEQPEPLPAFADYIARMAEQQSTEETRQFARQWAERVKDYPEPPSLFGRANPERETGSVRIVRRLSEEQTDHLTALCRQPDVRAWTTDLALFNVLLTAVFAYVSRISGQHDLVIGAPAHNRVSADDKRTAGLFMELFPLRTTLDPNDTLGDVLAKVKVAGMEFLRNARPGTSSAQTGRRFNVLLNFINRSFHEGEQAITTEWLHPGYTEAGHHFKVQVYDFDAAGRWTFCFDMNTAVIPPEMHGIVADGFMDLLWQIMSDRTAPLHEPSATDRRFFAGAEAHTDDGYPTDVTVLDQVEAQVAATPDRTAVRFADASLTFAELDLLAEHFARILLTHGIKRGDVVPVCAHRSLGLLVGLLGILKTGAAYLPLDPDFPEERLAFLCADAGARYVVVSEGLHDSFKSLPVRTLEPGVSVPAYLSPISHPRPRPVDPMYVLYTSGSTGTPKGVINQHDGLVNRLEWARRTFVPDGERTVILQKTTFTFDVSVWELFLPLVTGAELVLARPGGEKDADYLRETIRAYGVTMLHFVPPMLELFVLQPAELPSLKTVICSGEALLPHQVNAFNAAYSNARLHNLYGPTEAAIDVTHWPASSTPVGRVPIGKPVTNVSVRVYGEDGRYLPVGVPGELYLGGVQVARGYHNRPELTAAKFVEKDGQRWYRTGDLVRWLPDTNLEYLGRIDTQVKLRGLRIELGEVEARLAEVPAVRQAVVLLKEDGKGEPALVAYVVAGQPTDAAKLRTELALRLPGYMVPTVYVLLDELPLLANGKIDRKALPGPVCDGSAAAGDAPQGDFETLLHGIWTEVFRLDAVGRTAHFLDLGGHSLTGIRLVNRVNEDFALQLPANFVFRFPTIATQATEIERTIRKLMAAMDKS